MKATHNYYKAIARYACDYLGAAVTGDIRQLQCRCMSMNIR